MIEGLPRREREVFELLCRLEVATAAAVRAAMPDTLSDSAVRTLLKRLEDRGLVSRASGGEGFEYRPVPRTESVAAGAATALLGMGEPLKADEIAALEKLLDQARERDQ